MRCLTHEHDENECPKEIVKKVPQLGEKETTQPPKKKKKVIKTIKPPDKKEK